MQEMLRALDFSKTAENQNAGTIQPGVSIYRSNNMNNRLSVVDLLTSAVYHVYLLTADRNVVFRYP